jgi:RHS repeat-associated protein
VPDHPDNTVDCTSGIERFVWAGDNILWEMRGPGASTEAADRLEQEYAMRVEYGIVGYTHAGGVDRPLATYKTNGGNAGAVVVPHMNWRGLFSLGTNPSGGASTTPVEWPGFRTTANHSMGETQAITKNWMGSLLEGQRDAGGRMYMRNRYYDPQTGQFTQTDPIGIAGGLNTYGFANGDPVSYDDPYGLCPKTLRLAPAAAADGPVPAVDAALAVACVVELGIIGFRWYRTARTAEALLSTASDDELPAAGRLPDLDGMTEEEAEATLGQAGFEKGQNAGSYRRYRHEDGSQVSVGPDGRVVRQGPQVQSGANARSYRRRYGPDGKQIEHDPSGSNTHNTGEVINVPKP